MFGAAHIVGVAFDPILGSVTHWLDWEAGEEGRCGRIPEPRLVVIANGPNSKKSSDPAGRPR